MQQNSDRSLILTTTQNRLELRDSTFYTDSFLGETTVNRVNDAPHTTTEAGIAYRPALPTLVVCATLLSAQLLPEAPVYFGAASSFSVGTILSATLISLCALIFVHIFQRKSTRTLLDSPAFGLQIVLLVLAVVFIQAVAANHILPIDKTRFAESFAPLVVLFSGGIAISAVFSLALASQLDSAARVSFWVLLGVILIRLLHMEPPGAHFDHPTFPFTETSHFALAFGPIYIYRCATCRPSHRTLWILFGLALGVALKSATLLVFVFGGALISRRFIFALAITTIPLAAGAATHLSYFTSRADISSHSSSVSALVYLQGWDFLLSSLQRTHGIGLGFQQLGVHSLHLEISHLIRLADGGGNLNQYDGSFLLSKLGSEFGLLGILLVAVYCVYGLKMLRAFRFGMTSPHRALAQCIFIGFAVDIFTRGMGYFCGSTLLFIGATLSLNNHHSQSRNLSSRYSAISL